MQELQTEIPFKTEKYNKNDDEFNPLHREYFDKKMRETPVNQTPKKKRESISQIDYYINLLNIRDERIDNVTGITLKNNRYELNRVPIKFIENQYKAIEINRNRYRLTRGLNELLFMKQPDQRLVSNIDERNFKKIALDAMFSAERKLVTLKSSQYLTGTGMYIQENKKKKKNLCTGMIQMNSL